VDSCWYSEELEQHTTSLVLCRTKCVSLPKKGSVSPSRYFSVMVPCCVHVCIQHPHSIWFILCDSYSLLETIQIVTQAQHFHCSTYTRSDCALLTGPVEPTSLEQNNGAEKNRQVLCQIRPCWSHISYIMINVSIRHHTYSKLMQTVIIKRQQKWIIRAGLSKRHAWGPMGLRDPK